MMYQVYTHTSMQVFVLGTATSHTEIFIEIKVGARPALDVAIKRD